MDERFLKSYALAQFFHNLLNFQLLSNPSNNVWCKQPDPKLNKKWRIGLERLVCGTYTKE